MALKIGNAQGFWGDSSEAPSRLVEQQPDLDVLTLDYLAEVSMSLLAQQRERRGGAGAGFAMDFLEVVDSLIPHWKRGAHFKLVTNAGGLDPEGCGRAVLERFRSAGLERRVAVVTGDDVLPLLQADPEASSFAHLETGDPLVSVAPRLVTANAYLGAREVAAALRAGAEVVITGRVADPSLTLGPCMAAFGWEEGNWDALAGGTVAGHLIECGAQACGGISTDWLSLPDPAHIGFPVVIVESDGSCVVTKPPGTGGTVNLRTIKEQLLYEIGDPGRYLSPDLTVSFLSIQLEETGRDQVRVTGARGAPPSPHYKVSACYRDGFWAQGMLTIAGVDALAKARRCGELVLQRVSEAAGAPRDAVIECLGSGACFPEAGPRRDDLLETVLRVAVADSRRELVERFTRELSPWITAGPQGVTGYAGGRPKVHPLFGYWPCLIPRDQVHASWRWIA